MFLRQLGTRHRHASPDCRYLVHRGPRRPTCHSQHLRASGKLHLTNIGQATKILYELIPTDLVPDWGKTAFFASFHGHIEQYVRNSSQADHNAMLEKHEKSQLERTAHYHPAAFFTSLSKKGGLVVGKIEGKSGLKAREVRWTGELTEKELVQCIQKQLCPQGENAADRH